MGKAPHAPLSPSTRPKSGAPTLKRFCPAGANSVDPAHRQHILAPLGKDASFPPTFPSALEACFPHSPAAASDKKRRKPLPSRKEENPQALLPPPPPPTPTAALRARADADIERPCGAYPCTETAPPPTGSASPRQAAAAAPRREPRRRTIPPKSARAEIEKLCRENAATRRTKPRRAMPSVAGNAVRPCRSRRFFRAGASYSLAAVL